MAAPKKKTTAKAKPAAKSKTAPAKTAPAKKDDPIQETIELVKGFQLHTLIALGLGLSLLICLIVQDLRYVWELNILFAAGSGYMFWRQSTLTEGVEQKVCRWGLVLVAVMFLWRDIHISQTLNDLANLEFNNPFSKG